MPERPYEIHLDAKYHPLERFDILNYAADQKPWWNQTLVGVNDCVARIGVLDGDFHWHKHENEDELFVVLEGRLRIEFEGGEVDLLPGQAVMIPRGVMHCPHALGRTVVLMFEGAGVVPTGD
jgi:mannose-6-phosphate isomerase-like protein (cupin superfamily)